MAARNPPLELGLPCIGEPPYYLAHRMAARNPPLELGLPCIGEPPYYLAHRMAARNPPLELGRRDSSTVWRTGWRLGIRSWRSAGGIAVLFGALG